ncbi:hypothetical protein K439DRAFT_1636675 [Ramaria rubella]|nr:hypothetical protein K439DRAFT_1636675 [Ramaria rubella]
MFALTPRYGTRWGDNLAVALCLSKNRSQCKKRSWTPVQEFGFVDWNWALRTSRLGHCGQDNVRARRICISIVQMILTYPDSQDPLLQVVRSLVTA